MAQPVTASHPSPAATQTAYEVSLYSKYLGVLALMGRLVSSSKLTADERDSVDRAFADANRVLAARAAGIRFERASPGCYAAFDAPPTPPEQS